MGINPNTNRACLLIALIADRSGLHGPGRLIYLGFPTPSDIPALKALDCEVQGHHVRNPLSNNDPGLEGPGRTRTYATSFAAHGPDRLDDPVLIRRPEGFNRAVQSPQQIFSSMTNGGLFTDR